MVVHTCTTDPGGDAGAGFEGSSGLFKKKKWNFVFSRANIILPLGP